jgi:signal transduction histidine kinase
MINDLLDVSRMVTGRISLDLQSIDLRAVVDTTLDAIRPEASAKGVRLEIVLPLERAGACRAA